MTMVFLATGEYAAIVCQPVEKGMAKRRWSNNHKNSVRESNPQMSQIYADDGYRRTPAQSVDKQIDVQEAS
jgi:hypothetical protein